MTTPTAPPAQFAAPGPGEPFDGAATPTDLARPLYGASLGQSVARFFKSYAKFSGRASRSEYWWLTLFITIIAVIFGIIIGVLSGGSTVDEYDTATLPGSAIAVLIIYLIFFLAIIVPSLSLQWRRLHDANLAGPFFFLSLIPSVGSLIVLILSILPPKPEGRRFDR